MTSAPAEFEQASAACGQTVTHSTGGGSRAAVEEGPITVKVYVDDKEITSRIKISTLKKS
ncbi:MAG: hypothetical protein ACREBU_02960 [Nitrososphaera sp.]